ncbi:hypothetical protein [Maribacter aurantiacus]|nr:hypothetical protein [Maribacter aurantiacus]
MNQKSIKDVYSSPDSYRVKNEPLTHADHNNADRAISTWKVAA